MLVGFLTLVSCQVESKIELNTFPSTLESTRREMIGKRLYFKYCAGCHGETGEGDGMHSYTLNPFPANHTDSSYMNELTDEYLFKIISKGGTSVGKSPEMPRWNLALNANEVWNIIIYIRTLPKKQKLSVGIHEVSMLTNIERAYVAEYVRHLGKRND